MKCEHCGVEVLPDIYAQKYGPHIVKLRETDSQSTFHDSEHCHTHLKTQRDEALARAEKAIKRCDELSHACDTHDNRAHKFETENAALRAELARKTEALERRRRECTGHLVHPEYTSCPVCDEWAHDSALAEPQAGDVK